MTSTEPTDLNWRKSSFSSPTGDCVEVATLDEGLLLRNSNNIEAGSIPFTRAELRAFILGCKAGEFDDLQ